MTYRVSCRPDSVLRKKPVKNFIAIVVAALLAACGHSSDPASPKADSASTKSASTGPIPTLVNGDFEQVAADGSIPGWTTLQHAGPQSYEMVIDPDGAYAGHGSFRMTRTQDQVYGTLSQDVAIAGAAGETIELSAMVKTKDVGPEGWKLMISGDRVHELSPAATGTSDWHRVSVRVQLPAATTGLTVGVTLLDKGSGWMDDVQLRAIAR
jgi:hypothetical protein